MKFVIICPTVIQTEGNISDFIWKHLWKGKKQILDCAFPTSFDEIIQLYILSGT